LLQISALHVPHSPLCGHVKNFVTGIFTAGFIKPELKTQIFQFKLCLQYNQSLFYRNVALLNCIILFGYIVWLSLLPNMLQFLTFFYNTTEWNRVLWLQWTD